jgi:hypothetical protein
MRGIATGRLLAAGSAAGDPSRGGVGPVRGSSGWGMASRHPLAGRVVDKRARQCAGEGAKEPRVAVPDPGKPRYGAVPHTGPYVCTKRELDRTTRAD